MHHRRHILRALKTESLLLPPCWEIAMHALIIETQPLISMMMEDELRQLGFTSFDTASTQDEAVAAAIRQCPDLITASIRIAEGCGIEAVKIICAHKAIPTVYTVSNPEEAEKAISGSIIITKPIAKDELQQAVERVTQRMDDDRSRQTA